MESTIVTGVDLRRVAGLESVKHASDSHIGIDTVYLSNGEIPDRFLRGVGVPEDMVDFIRALRGQFYSCFISHSTKDKEFAERVHSDLTAEGIRCWYAPHDMQGGKVLVDQIDEAIKHYRKLLLILSPNSIKSDWVKVEIAKARAHEKQQGASVLFPIRLCSFNALQKWKYIDNTSGEDHAEAIRKFHIPDFSNWTDPASYQAAFLKLLRDLKPASAATA
jgi:TIR domain